MARKSFFPSSETKERRKMAEQAKAQQTPTKKPAPTTLEEKERLVKAIEEEHARLEHSPPMAVTYTKGADERTIVYTEEIRAEALFSSKTKSRFVVRQSREIVLELEPVVDEVKPIDK